MDRGLALLLIGLVLGGGIGFVIAAGAGVTLDGHDHGAAGATGAASGHAHEMPLRMPAGDDAPALDIAVTRDAVSGWNLHAMTENFTFAAARAGEPHIPGEGHAHVYVDGEKIARLYGPWLHIAELPDGATVVVTLNANDHRPLAVGDAPVAASVVVAE